ncbi:MAG: 6-hydroxymethylpterin diphosphokinase MptE-like protein [Phycisphaerales bacterium]
MATLAALRNRHWGQRCFIVGNGPSLADMDLSVLRDEFVFGVNRIMLHEAYESWRRVYYCCVNPFVLEQTRDRIAALRAVKFLPWEERDRTKGWRSTVHLRTRHEPRFSFDVADCIWQGATVTYVAMQLAFHMGFADVVLIGVDHHYERAGQPNTLVTAREADPDHFSPSYFGPGVKWQLPDLEQSETAYRLAKQAFEQEGRRIRDATVNGRLAVFEKARFEELF